MNENLEKIRILIGDEKLKRVLEIMGIFGIKFPDDFDIYGADSFSGVQGVFPFKELKEDWYKNYAVILSRFKKSADCRLDRVFLDELGRFEFNENHQVLVFIKNGIFYEWAKRGDKLEILHVGKENKFSYKEEFSVYFNLEDEGVQTSALWIMGTYVTGGSPAIISYIDEVKVTNHVKFSEEAPLEEYYNFFLQLLANQHFNYAIPDSLYKGYILDIIGKVFETPITELVAKVKNDDQNWRYEGERKKIISDCNYEKEKAKEQLDEVVKKAQRYYEYAVQSAEQKKNLELEKLATKRADYNSGKASGAPAMH